MTAVEPVKKKRYTPRKQPAPVENFFEVLGKDEVIKALQVSTQAPLVNLLKALTDPSRDMSFLGLCNTYNVAIHDLVLAFQEYQHSEGVIRMMRHVPQVMEDVAIDAKSRSECCPRCDGKKVIVDLGDKGTKIKRNCPLCRGAGEIRIVGDKMARDLIFDSIGEKKAKGPQVAIQQNFTRLEDMLSLSQKVITGQ